MYVLCGNDATTNAIETSYIAKKFNSKPCQHSWSFYPLLFRSPFQSHASLKVKSVNVIKISCSAPAGWYPLFPMKTKS